jgi:DNA-binding response OmpR family regulator
MASVLVIEDEEGIGALLSTSLEANGHEVEWRRTGAEAVRAAHGHPVDLALLDLGLPDLDGISVCRELKRAQPLCVVVILTARNHEMDVVEGLEAGADDYLSKPFRMTELLARVGAHLRRAAVADFVPEVFSSADLTVDGRARRCLIRDQEVPLRPKEFDLLARLAAEPGRAVSRERLMDDVWDPHWFGSTKTLDVHIASLRHRLADSAAALDPPGRIPAISTVRGHGYRLDAKS